MTHPSLLTYRQAASGVRVDLDVLVRSRMLIQANSGGGKSWALRQLLEETFGRVQHIVLDPEGEFSTLREEYDYVLGARQGGDVEATPRTAKVLCRRLMEVQASAILDLYDLKVPERRDFVKLFLTELLSLPKDLRRPLLVVLDEAHVFAPEGSKSEALEAVATLASQGRKRGYALVCATQRLSKLSKDVAAELNTKLIGRTGLDLDVKRAGDELGMDKEARQQLPNLEPGTFFAYGPALVPQGPPRLVRTGRVKTSHPEAGSVAAAAVTPPSARVKALLAQALADLPQQATEELRTTDALRKRIAELERQLRAAPKGEPRVVERPVADPRAIARAVAEAVKPWRDFGRDVMKVLHRGAQHARGLSDLLAVVPAPPSGDGVGGSPSGVSRDGYAGAGAVGGATPAASNSLREKPSRVPFTPRRDTSVPPHHSNGDLPKGERAILTAIAQHDDGVSREQLTVLTGYKRSSRDTYLQKLQQKGFVGANGDRILVTDDGMAALGDDFEPLPTGRALLDHWLSDGKLVEGERRILAIVADAYPDPLSRDAISDATGYKRSSRDTYLQKLAARRLVVTTNEGVRMNARLHG